MAFNIDRLDTHNRTRSWTWAAVVFAAGFYAAPAVHAADPTPASADTAAVLGKLHHGNQMEIDMGKLAQEKGESKDVKAFGKALVKDHSAADKKVTALAKEQDIDLSANTPSMPMDDMNKLKGMSGAEFDRAFAQAMLDDHQKDVDDAKAAQERTTDPKLKKLLTATIPVLEKHRDTARKLVASTGAGGTASTAGAGAGTAARPTNTNDSGSAPPARAGANPTAPGGGTPAPAAAGAPAGSSLPAGGGTTR
jgi:putative membrane protein